MKNATIMKLTPAAIASAILITVATADTQQFATLSDGWRSKSQTINVCETGCNKGSVDYVAFSNAFLEKVIDAIAEVESSGRANIMGDKGQAAGAWQLHKRTVCEVNRIYKTTYSWPTDCLDEKTARQIVRFYLIICGYKKKSLQETVRRFNGGYKYWQSEAARHFWKKVEKELGK